MAASPARKLLSSPYIGLISIHVLGKCFSINLTKYDHYLIAVLGFTRCLRAELSPCTVDVTLSLPLLTDSPNRH